MVRLPPATYLTLARPALRLLLARFSISSHRAGGRKDCCWTWRASSLPSLYPLCLYLSLFPPNPLHLVLRTPCPRLQLWSSSYHTGLGMVLVTVIGILIVIGIENHPTPASPTAVHAAVHDVLSLSLFPFPFPLLVLVRFLLVQQNSNPVSDVSS